MTRNFGDGFQRRMDKCHLLLQLPEDSVQLGARSVTSVGILVNARLKNPPLLHQRSERHTVRTFMV